MPNLLSAFQISFGFPSISTSIMIFAPVLNPYMKVSASVNTVTSRWVSRNSSSRVFCSPDTTAISLSRASEDSFSARPF